MRTVMSESYNGDTVSMKKGKKGYCCYVNGRKASKDYKSKMDAKREYNKLKTKYSGNGKYGEQTMRDALGL